MFHGKEIRSVLGLRHRWRARQPADFEIAGPRIMAGSGAALSIAGRIWRTWLSASRGFGATGSSIPIAIGRGRHPFPGTNREDSLIRLAVAGNPAWCRPRPQRRDSDWPSGNKIMVAACFAAPSRSTQPVENVLAAQVESGQQLAIVTSSSRASWSSKSLSLFRKQLGRA